MRFSSNELGIQAAGPAIHSETLGEEGFFWEHFDQLRCQTLKQAQETGTSEEPPAS